MDLFNRNNEGAKLLHQLTGSYYASNDFDAIQSEIDFATSEVAAIIGKEVVGSAKSAYENSVEEVFVKKVQMPIACLAVMRHFAQNIITHEDAGRRMKVDENAKTPFAWMLDRDDLAMRERYYRALDALFRYLAENKADLWAKSEVCKLTSQSILHSIHEFERFYPIDHSYYTFAMLIPLIIEAQDLRLKGLLGDRWPTILSAASETDRKVLVLAQKYAVLYAVTTAAERWSITVFPLSISRRFAPSFQGSEASMTASIKEISWYIGNLRKQQEETLDLLSRSVSSNTEEPTLLPTNDRKNKFFRLS